MSRKHKLVIYIFLIIIFIVYIYLVNNRSEKSDFAPEKYKELIAFSYDDVLSFKLYLTVGFDEYSEIYIDENRKDELFNIIKNSFLKGFAGRYNATKHYIVRIKMKSQEEYRIDVLMQNYDNVRIIFGNRYYYSSSLIEWFKSNEKYIMLNAIK